MKKSVRILSLICLLFLPIIILSGCGGKKFKNVGEWETQKVSKIYTMEELGKLTESQCKTLEKTYIKVKCKFDRSSLSNGLYYMNYVHSIKESGFQITGIDYSNYWELKFSFDDEIYIEGWVEEYDPHYSDYSAAKRLLINPAYVTKA